MLNHLPVKLEDQDKLAPSQRMGCNQPNAMMHIAPENLASESLIDIGTSVP